MKYVAKIQLLVSLLAWLAAGPGNAQQLPAVPTPANADKAMVLARQDTIQRLQQLFAAQRRAPRVRTTALAGLSLACFTVLQATQGPPETNFQRVGRGVQWGFMGYTAYLLVRGISKQRRYRPARERQLIAAVEQGQPLPAWVRKKLR